MVHAVPTAPRQHGPRPDHPSATDSALEEMLRLQVVERGITDERLLAALRAVPRQHFFPPGSRDNVYADRATPIGHGQTISQPYIVALMTLRLGVEPHHRVLEIGTGSGYQTAVLARLAAEVYTVERVKPLLDAAFERLLSLHLRNIHFRHADGTLGWPGLEGTFDRLLIAAGAPALPRQLLTTCLKPGGAAVLPVGPPDRQTLVHVTRDADDRLTTTDICPCRFVKLLGEEGWHA
jgi:protein-L-isoaspartate(D-aspartate) O-methyltransferase